MAEKEIDLAYVLLHPMRRQIVLLLKKESSPLYISEIARRLKMDNKLTSFHLATLLQYDLVSGEWEMLKPKKGAPKAVKYYALTPKAERILKSLNIKL